MYRHRAGIWTRIGAGGWTAGAFIQVLRKWLPRRWVLGPTAGLLTVVCFQVRAWCFVQVVNLGARAEAKRADGLSSNRTNDCVLATNDSLFSGKPGAPASTICVAHRAGDGVVFFVRQVTLS